MPFHVGSVQGDEYGTHVTAISSHLSAAFSYNNIASRRRPAVKVAVIQLLMLAAFTAFGHFDLALLASIGMFAVLYAPEAPYRRRLFIVSSVAIAMFLCAALGIAVGDSAPLLLLAVIVLSAVSSFACTALAVGPPSAYFLMLGCGVVNYMVYRHDVPASQVLIMALVGGLLAVAGTMVELAAQPYRPEKMAVSAAVDAVEAYVNAEPGESALAFQRKASASLHAAWTALSDAAPLFPNAPWARRRVASIESLRERTTDAEYRFTVRLGNGAIHYFSGGRRQAGIDSAEHVASAAGYFGGRAKAGVLLRHAATWPSENLVTAFRVAVAAVIAGLVTLALSGEHIYWSTAFAAVALHMGGARIVQTYRAINRLAGTILGIALFTVIIWVSPSPWVMVFLIAGLQLLVELFVAKQYALATLFITPLALLISIGGKIPEDPWPIMGERLLDTVIGVAAAWIAIWLFGRSLPVTVLRAQMSRTLRAAARYIESPESDGARESLYTDLRLLDSATAAVKTEKLDSGLVGHGRDIANVGFMLIGSRSVDSASWNDKRIDKVRQTLLDASDDLATKGQSRTGESKIEGITEKLAASIDVTDE